MKVSEPVMIKDYLKDLYIKWAHLAADVFLLSSVLLFLDIRNGMILSIPAGLWLLAVTILLIVDSLLLYRGIPAELYLSVNIAAGILMAAAGQFLVPMTDPGLGTRILLIFLIGTVTYHSASLALRGYQKGTLLLLFDACIVLTVFDTIAEYSASLTRISPMIPLGWYTCAGLTAALILIRVRDTYSDVPDSDSSASGLRRGNLLTGLMCFLGIGSGIGLAVHLTDTYSGTVSRSIFHASGLILQKLWKGLPWILDRFLRFLIWLSRFFREGPESELPPPESLPDLSMQEMEYYIGDGTFLIILLGILIVGIVIIMFLMLRRKRLQVRLRAASGRSIMRQRTGTRDNLILRLLRFIRRWLGRVHRWLHLLFHPNDIPSLLLHTRRSLKRCGFGMKPAEDPAAYLKRLSLEPGFTAAEELTDAFGFLSGLVSQYYYGRPQGADGRISRSDLPRDFCRRYRRLLREADITQP